MPAEPPGPQPEMLAGSVALSPVTKLQRLTGLTRDLGLEGKASGNRSSFVLLQQRLAWREAVFQAWGAQLRPLVARPMVGWLRVELGVVPGSRARGKYQRRPLPAEPCVSWLQGNPVKSRL